MTIEVELFGPLQDAVGRKTVTVEQSETTVGTVLALLEDEHGGLADYGVLADDGLPDALTVTKNGEHVTQLDGVETTLEDGDVLRLAPPVTGG